jgi:hypothetical protein
MYTLSLWASRHQWQARVVIVLASLILYLVAWLCGALLAAFETYISATWTSFFLFTGLGCMVLYPKRYTKAYHSYVFRKVLDTILTFCSVMLLFCFSNQQENTQRPDSFPPHFVNATHAARHYFPVKPVVKPQKQVLRKYIRTIKAYMSKASKKQNTALVILTVLLGIGLGLIVAMLSCSIACNGSGVAAGFVLTFGLTGIFFLCRNIIRNIRHPKKKEPANPPAVSL